VDTSGGDAAFIGSTPMKLLDGAWFAHATGAKPPAEEVIVAIRPEYLEETGEEGANGGIEGRVSIVENLGTSALVTLPTSGPNVQVTVAEGREPEPGSTMRVTPRDGRTLVYRAGDGELIGGLDQTEGGLSPL
jgi:multiple sugar transport system ATP-binding protein